MNRRTFIKSSLGAGVVAGSALTLGNAYWLFGTGVSPKGEPYDLVAVRNGEPAEMFDRAIESFGGIGRFVKRGQTVVVKPNIGWDVPVERAGNTNPALVKRIVEHCFQAGAKDVFVFDNTCDLWTNCYTNSGIEAAAKSAGAKVVTGNSEKNYREITIPGSDHLKTAKVHELILDSDVFINVPVLKHHSSARVTIAMKNLMGIVWDRRWWHRNNLQKCIAEFASFRKPDLNVVDAYRIMTRNGPRGVSEADVTLMKQLLVSTDIVAIDAAAAKIFGSEPEDIPHIVMAHEMGLGTKNLQSLSINRIVL